MVTLGPLVVPSDDAPIGVQQADPIDAELGELLHRPRRPVALRRARRPPDRRVGYGSSTTGPVGSSRNGDTDGDDAGPPRPRPSETVTDSPRPNPQRTDEVVLVPVIGMGVVEVVDEAGGRRRPRSHWKADLILDSSPRSGGRDHFLPLGRQLPEQLVLALVEAGRGVDDDADEEVAAAVGALHRRARLGLGAGPHGRTACRPGW